MASVRDSEPGESPSQFITRIGNYLQRWIDLAQAAETYDGVKKLFIEEQYFQTCPKEMATHLKEGKPETLQDLAERAETYLEAHSSDILFGIDPKSSRSQGSRSPPPKRCHNCGSPDHLRNQCPKPQTPTSPKHPRAPQPPFPPRPVPFQRQPSYGGFKPTSPPREPPRCYVCNKLGHVARECRLKSTAAMEHHGYYRSPPRQQYFWQQNLPQYYSHPQVSEPNVMREPAQDSGRPVPSGPAKTTTPPVSKPRSPPPPDFRLPALT